MCDSSASCLTTAAQQSKQTTVTETAVAVLFRACFDSKLGIFCYDFLNVLVKFPLILNKLLQIFATIFV